MPRRTMSAEQRAAASARMKAMHAAKKQAKENPVPEQEPHSPEPNETLPSPMPSAPTVSETPPVPTVPSAPTVTLTQEQFQMMLDRLSSSEGTKQVDPMTLGQPSLNSKGGVTGIIERFPINPAHYINPVEELYDTPELRRWGLRENYVIDWSCSPTKYQTAMGTWYIEPRFELILKKRQFDENNEELVKIDPRTGKDYHPRIVLGRASFFEDPPANILEAELAGLSIDDLDSGEFQEKMRMYRYKFWLIERLNPKKPQYTTNHRREEVIGGKVYEIEEYSNPI